MNIALVDMDQTLCDYEGAVKSKLAELYPNVNFSGKSLEDFKPAIDLIKQVPGFWRTLPEIEFGFEIVELLKAYKFDIHILSKGTYKTTSAWSEKCEWCREHLPGVPITITEDKSLVYGSVLVDDWPTYCEKWLEWRPRGVVIMPAYDYNLGFDVKHSSQVIRASRKNWDEVEAVINTAANRKSGEAL